jgi:hypothetical protein
MYRDGSLKIKPAYQRKPVWTARQKCYLIESILMRLPVPEIYIQQSITPEGEDNYGIVDGQQRIRTVLQFIGAETDPSEQESNQFALDKLSPQSTWKGLRFSELSDEEKTRFYGYNFAIRYLITDSEDEVRDVFRRLNKYLTPLNAQELRNATYSGPFVQLVVSLADKDYWIDNKIVSPAQIRRSIDVEFVGELLIGVMHGPQGGSARVIDSYFEQYEEYEMDFPGQREAQLLFDRTLETVKKIFPTIKDERWSNKTDFYTLFVALASLLRSGELPTNKISALKKRLHNFASEVYKRLADESAKVSKTAIGYVRAVEKGANDKKRRGDRHLLLTSVMKSYFKTSKKKG